MEKYLLRLPLTPIAHYVHVYVYVLLLWKDAVRIDARSPVFMELNIGFLQRFLILKQKLRGP